MLSKCPRRPRRVGMLSFALCVFTVLGAISRHASAVEFECFRDGAEERCSLVVNESLSVEVAGGNVAELSDRPGFHLSGDVILRTPARDYNLLAADLVFERLPAGSPIPFEVYGSAGAPIGELPVLGDFIQAAPRASVGLVTRRTLEELAGPDLPLAENVGPDGTLIEPVYVLFHLDTAIELDLHLAELLGLNTEPGAHDPFQYSFPYNKNLTVILDPFDPYFYLSELPLNTQDPAAETHQTNQNNNQPRPSTQSSTGTGTHAQGNGRAPSLGAFAFSGRGGIPFEPETTWGLPADTGRFKGQVYVEAEIPLPYRLSVDGSVVAYAGEEGAEIGANGDILAGFDLPGGVVSLELPLGSASAGLRLREDEVATWFSGVLDPDFSFLPPEIPISPVANLNVAAYVSSRNLEESRLLAEGTFDLGTGALGDLFGIDLTSAMTIDGELSLDRRGVWLRGRSYQSLHPALSFGGSVYVECLISVDNPWASYVILRGDLSVAGTLLGASAEARLSADGLFVEGFFMTPVTNVRLAGQITDRGPRLEGYAEVRFDLAELNRALDDAEADLRQAQSDLNWVSGEIDRIRGIVRGERQRDAARLADARFKVEDAQRKVNSIQSNIDHEHRMIAQRKREMAANQRRFDNMAWWDKAWGWAWLAAENGWRGIEIAGRGITIGTLEASRFVAQGVLTVAREALRGMERAAVTFPIDADPRLVGLFTYRETARTALDLAQRIVAAIPELHGSLVGEIHLVLGFDGIRGSVSAQINGQEVLGGRVEIDHDPRACVTLPVIGEACVGF